MNSDFKEDISLEVIYDREVIFQSKRRWLFPLFDLMDYLKDNPVNMKQAEVHDRIVGRAAALLLLRLGAGRVYGDLMSDLAIDVFRGAGIPYSFGKSVNKIDCNTEVVLRGIDDPEEAYTILCQRAKRH